MCGSLRTRKIVIRNCQRDIASSSVMQPDIDKSRGGNFRLQLPSDELIAFAVAFNFKDVCR